jgi:uncharacterized protein (DUF1499 family)
MTHTRELIQGVLSSMNEKSVLQRSIQAFREEIASRIIRTVDTKDVNKAIEKIEFS